jgi:hypothetical protein
MQSDIYKKRTLTAETPTGYFPNTNTARNAQLNRLIQDIQSDGRDLNQALQKYKTLDKAVREIRHF